MYAQLLIAASFAIAAYQDFRERAVLDLVWIPAAVGVAYSIYWAFPNLEFPVLKLAIVGGIALAFVLLGGVGQADAIGLALIAGDPYQLSPILPLVGGAIVAVAHIGYEYLSGNARGVRTVPLEKFLREQRWIPKAIVADGTRTDVSNDVNDAREEVEAKAKPGATVEVTYGVPTVAYLGIGYIGYLAYLLVFQQHVFFSLP
ncbi:MAG TPA: hypothetical protein VKF15_00265 [Nitrososphaerales archaeon]|nr:hypothetical protein [Nitrososphaerales archaeon]